VTGILYVDASSEMCHIVCHIFEATGTMRVYLAHSGEEALASPALHQVDVIISDIPLPGMDGIRLLKMVRRAGIRVPFIFFTHGFTALLNDEIYPPNIFRFNGRGSPEKREILCLLRVVYWVTGDHEMSVMPVIMDDIPRTGSKLRDSDL
jgi:hypothetical protein